MINIGIIGIGGVGGYLGAKLSSCYESNDSIRISLFTRGDSALVIKKNGLTLKSVGLDTTIITRPYAVYEPHEKAPKMDYLFVCVKSYSIESIVERIKDVADSNTVIIPFQNGVDGRLKIIEALPDYTVIDGCVYVISHIESPGVIVENGIPDKIRYLYGGTKAENEKLKELDTILFTASNQINLVDGISDIVWAKFSRISTLSTIQTYHNITSGQIGENAIYKEEYIGLVNEFYAVTKALGYRLDDDIVNINLVYADSSPYGMTTSMQRDFTEGKISELEGQTGYIVAKGKELGIEAPLYEMMYNALKSRNK